MLIRRSTALLCAVIALIAGCTRPHLPQEPLGPHPVDFVYWNPSAKSVFLAGDFNGWNTTSTSMHRGENNRWTAQVVIKPGRHQYKFIADGHWTQDPSEVKRISLDCGAEHLAFSPDGRYITATRRDNTVGLWSTKDWKPAIEFLPTGGYIAALTFSPESKTLGIATSEDGLSIWPLP